MEHADVSARAWRALKVQNLVKMSAKTSAGHACVPPSRGVHGSDTPPPTHTHTQDRATPLPTSCSLHILGFYTKRFWRAPELSKRCWIAARVAEFRPNFDQFCADVARLENLAKHQTSASIEDSLYTCFKMSKSEHAFRMALPSIPYLSSSGLLWLKSLLARAGMCDIPTCPWPRSRKGGSRTTPQSCSRCAGCGVGVRTPPLSGLVVAMRGAGLRLVLCGGRLRRGLGRRARTTVLHTRHEALLCAGGGCHGDRHPCSRRGQGSTGPPHGSVLEDIVPWVVPVSGEDGGVDGAVLDVLLQAASFFSARDSCWGVSGGAGTTARVRLPYRQ